MSWCGRSAAVICGGTGTSVAAAAAAALACAAGERSGDGAAGLGAAAALARSVAASYLDSRARLGFPMAPKAWADEVTAQLAAAAAKKAA